MDVFAWLVSWSAVFALYLALYRALWLNWLCVPALIAPRRVPFADKFAARAWRLRHWRVTLRYAGTTFVFPLHAARLLCLPRAVPATHSPFYRSPCCGSGRWRNRTCAHRTPLWISPPADLPPLDAVVLLRNMVVIAAERYRETPTCLRFDHLPHKQLFTELTATRATLRSTTLVSTPWYTFHGIKSLVTEQAAALRT
jgi:hypothetical protein